LKNSRKAMAGVDDDERGVTNSYTADGAHTLTIVNESGLYSLIFPALCSRHHRRPLLAQILIYYAPFSSLFDHGSHHGRVADYLDFARQAIGTG
jgi:hypothetical protein